MRDYTLNNPSEVERRRKIAAAHTMHGHRIMPKGSPEYRTFIAWCSMRQRCFDKNCKSYPSYGGRGISVAPEWMEYLQFWADMGAAPEGKQLDRIDNDGNYEPGNCRWATRSEQCRNRRSSRILKICGQEKTLAEWSELSGIPSSTIRMRIKYNGGVLDESTILSPVREKENADQKRERLDRAAAEMRAKNSKGTLEVTHRA